jgi:queuine/archaeosine tRNA-ribosyltransferase
MLEVKEMNANILLAIHNMRQYDSLFEMIREHLGKNFLGFVDAYIEANCVKKSQAKASSLQATLLPAAND